MPDEAVLIYHHVLAGVGQYHHLLSRLQFDCGIDLRGIIDNPVLYLDEGLKKGIIHLLIHFVCLLIFLSCLLTFYWSYSPVNSIHRLGIWKNFNRGSKEPVFLLLLIIYFALSDKVLVIKLVTC